MPVSQFAKALKAEGGGGIVSPINEPFLTSLLHWDVENTEEMGRL